MPLSIIPHMMLERDLGELVAKIPVDQAHMLRIVARVKDESISQDRLYRSVSQVIDTEEWTEFKLWHWRKHHGGEVSEIPPRDPRQDLKALSKMRKKDLTPFARFFKISPNMTKDELLEQLKPRLNENRPRFHQMLFSLLNHGLLSIASQDEGGEISLLISLNGDAKAMRKHLKSRWEDDHEILRSNMNRFLIESFELKGTLLGLALLDTDRRKSVEEEYEHHAVADHPIQIPGGVTTSAFGVVLWILKSLELKSGDRVLICGAKGALTAVLAKRVVGEKGEVRVLEWDGDTAEWAKKAVRRHGFKEKDISVIEQKDVTLGGEDTGYWSAIVMNGSVPKIPYQLLDQLDDEVGRLLFFMADHNRGGGNVCWVIRKNDAAFVAKELSKFLFTPIIGKYGWDDMEMLQQDYLRIKMERQKKNWLGDFQRFEHILPYPLSRAFSVAANAKSAENQHKRVVRLYELLDKYLAFITLSCFDTQERMSDKMKELLEKLSDRPASGDWMQVLRHSINQKSKMKELTESRLFLQRKVDSDVVLDTFLQLQNECGKKNAGRKKSVSVIDFLGQVVSYRNISQDGHGRLRGKGNLEKNAKFLRESFVELMSDDNPIKNWNLFYVQSNETRLDGSVHYVKQFLMGSTPQKKTCRDSTSKPLASGGVYLETGDSESLMLSPWLAYGEGEFGDPQLFVFKRNGTWETYHNSDQYPARQEQRQLEQLLQKYPPPTCPLPNKESGEAVFKEMLGLFVEDGLLEVWEINKLIGILRKFNMVADSEEGMQRIHSMVEEEFPDVVFEESEKSDQESS